MLVGLFLPGAEEHVAVVHRALHGLDVHGAQAAFAAPAVRQRLHAVLFQHVQQVARGAVQRGQGTMHHNGVPRECRAERRGLQPG